MTPRLTAGGYVFPVYGPASFGDTFGAPRPWIASGWHHGSKTSSASSAPRSWRLPTAPCSRSAGTTSAATALWLRDRDGNEFYYAHLSAFSPFAVNGQQVKAGTVLGFMGNSGDAETTPYHLHFEIHPVGLLYMGYDGVVNPYPYLLAWKRLEDVEFAKVAGWAPPISPTSSTPKPGAILLSSSDISTADGLDPGSLERALSAPTAKPARRGSPTGRAACAEPSPEEPVPSRRRLLRVVLAVLELFAFAEDLVLKPAASPRPRHGVEEDAEGDPGEEERRVAGCVR